MKTHIHVILDKSGSMQSVLTDTIGGFNAWLAKQKGAAGDQRLTLTLFDTAVAALYEDAPIEQVLPLTTATYVPGGRTALLDAIGKTVAGISPKARKVLVVIMTDGHENSSREHTRAAIANLIAEKEKAGWTFAYIGATLTGFAEAGALGISLRSTYEPSGIGTQSAFASLSTATMDYAAAPDAGSARLAYAARTVEHIPEDPDKTATKS